MDTVAAAVADSATAAAAPPTAAPATATPAGEKTISLAAVAGRWVVRSTPETGDTTATQYVLTATGDTSGWTIEFPNRRPIAVRVAAVAGDSVVTEAGPFESVRRKGVQVTTRGVLRRDGDRLVGTTTAHYRTTGPDSVVRLRTEGRRAP